MKTTKQKKINSIIFIRTFLLFFFTICILVYPNISLEAAKKGFILWSTVVFPALLPFFVVSDLLIQYGIVRFLGIFLEPIIRPLFKVSGVGGIIFTLSVVSGFPNGARMAAQLYKEGVLTKDEAERIAAFSNFSNPIFILGAVAIGMFGNMKMGIVLLLIHIVSNILVGILFGIGKKQPIQTYTFRQSLQNEWQNFLFASQKNESFGYYFADAVQKAVHTLLMIGGLIMVFAVVNELLKASYVTPFIADFINHVFPLFQENYIEVTITALLEVTIGLKHLSEIHPNVLFNQLLLAASLLAFNGFSVHAQVSSVLATEKLRYQPFLIGRILQTLISALLVTFFFRPFWLPYITGNQEIPAAISYTNSGTEFTYIYPFWLSLCFLIFTISLLLFYFYQKLNNKF